MNPFWSLDAIAFIMAASGLLPKRDEPMEGRPAAATPPKSAPTPLGVTVRGGCRGVGGSRGEGDGGGCWHILCCAPYLVPFGLFISLTGLIVRFRAHIT